MAQAGQSVVHAPSNLDRTTLNPNFGTMFLDHSATTQRFTTPEWRSALIVALLLTAATIAVHWFSPSKMQQSADMWDQAYRYHQTLEAFRVRPLTTNLIGVISSVTGTEFKTSFFSFQFAMFFISCLAFYWYLRRLTFTHRESLAGSSIFHLSVPVIMANFEPIHTWDDFWGYILIPLSIIALIRRKQSLAVIAIFVTLLAREINLILVPVWFGLSYLVEQRKLMRPIVLVGTAMALFAALRLSLSGLSTGERDINLLFNLDGFQRTRDTIFSLLIANGFIWLTGLWQAWRVLRGKLIDEQFFARAAIYSTALYVATGVFFGFARESRYFTIPAVFFVPLTLLFFREYRQEFMSLSSLLPRWWQKAVAAIALVAVSVWITKLVFPRFEFRPWHDGNWGFFALNLAVALIAVVATLLRRSKTAKANLA